MTGTDDGRQGELRRGRVVCFRRIGNDSGLQRFIPYGIQFVGYKKAFPA